MASHVACGGRRWSPAGRTAPSPRSHVTYCGPHFWSTPPPPLPELPRLHLCRFQECGSVATIAKGGDRYPVVVRFEKARRTPVLASECVFDCVPAAGGCRPLPRPPPPPPPPRPVSFARARHQVNYAGVATNNFALDELVEAHRFSAASPPPASPPLAPRQRPYAFRAAPPLLLSLRRTRPPCTGGGPRQEEGGEGGSGGEGGCSRRQGCSCGEGGLLTPLEGGGRGPPWGREFALGVPYRCPPLLADVPSPALLQVAAKK